MPSAITVHRNQMQTASGLNVIAGIWLFLSAFAIYAHGPMVANNIVFGLVVGVLALIRLSGAFDQSWLSWVNALCGVWVVISPWAIMGTGANGPTQAMVINNCITGGFIVLLGCWSAIASDTEPSMTAGATPSTLPR